MRLLLCDGHRMFVESLALALGMRGWTAVPVEDRTGLDEALVEGCPDVVVVAEDNREPGDGLELAHELRESVPDVRLLLLVGSDGPEARAAYDEGVVDGLVSKGCDLRTVQRAIGRLAEGDRVLEGLPVGDEQVEAPVETLTQREREVLALLLDGEPTAVMARRLGVSVNTLRSHLRQVFRKLDVNCRTKAARVALDLGLLEVA
jgi:DNA-binding NarL/FixJ family response regulator